MDSILEGIKVIDWCMWQAGPGGAAILGDMGADVIHIEQRGLGDQMRGIRVLFGVPQELPGGRQVTFEYANRNKRGISLDLSKPEGMEVMHRLVKKADVFMTNFRESSCKKLGLDYEPLKKLNPKLVYARGSCYGSKGPDSGVAGLDAVAAARSGIWMCCADADMDPGGVPVMAPVGIADEMTSEALAFGVIAALLARERSGKGQEVHTSQLGSVACRLLGWQIHQNLFLGTDGMRQKRSEARNPAYNRYLCKDGKWLALGLMREHEWPTLCSAVGEPTLASEPRYANADLRAKHCVELVAALDKAFLKKTRDEWLDILRKADLMFGPVNRISDLPQDPQMVENQYVTKFDHPSLGKIKVVGFPIEFSETPMKYRLAAPGYGQHTVEVLTEVGYTDEEISRLYQIEVL